MADSSFPPDYASSVFGEHIGPELKATLVDEYTNERTPTQGEFFYKIRLYQGVFGERNEYFESRWRARLRAVSSHLVERLDQLTSHPRFGPAFDAFQYIPALYSGLRLSRFFEFLFDNNREAMAKLDVSTLEAIQLKAPGACEADADDLSPRIRSGELFGSFTVPEREIIWTKMCSATTDHVVPSLFAFFENQKAFAYSENPLQHGLSDGQWFDFACRMLWTYAIREYQDMPPEQKRKLAKAGNSQANEKILFEFASLASRLGVRSRQVQDILKRDPDRAMARRFLQVARKPDQYRYDDIETSITQLVHIFNTTVQIQNNDEMEHVTNDRNYGEPEEYEIDQLTRPPNRCGLVNNLDQPRDKLSMFLAKLHRPIERQGRSLSSFFIQRSIYFAYFGKETSIPVDVLATLERQFRAIDLPLSGNVSHSPMSGHKQQQQEAELERLAVAIRDQQERLAELKRQTLSQEATQQEHQARIQDLHNLAIKEEGEIARLMHERQGLGDMLKPMRREENDLKTSINKLQSDIGQLQQDRQALQDDARVMDTDNNRRAQMAEEEAKHRTTLEELSRQMQELQEKIQRLTEKEVSQRTLIDWLSPIEIERQLRLEQLEEEERLKAAAVKELTAKVHELGLERDELQVRVDHLRPVTDELDRENQVAQRKNDESTGILIRPEENVAQEAGLEQFDAGTEPENQEQPSSVAQNPTVSQVCIASLCKKPLC
ncbi:hypothetical protein F4778DRAFT_802704 [Xylariomycetidae sp. FL2044]|nr:hypothetical protein F4778DRAFT_802704 [Xylariomycetidae sp. FL2044]